MKNIQYPVDLFFRLFLFCILVSITCFIIMLLLQKFGAILLSSAAFMCGLILMLIAYVLLSLLGSALLSYLIKSAHQALRYSFSLSARLRRQKFNFRHKKERLTTNYRNQSDYLKQNTRHSQQSLHDANTKRHIHRLAKQTQQQLRQRKKTMSPEIRKSICQTIHRCVKRLDMYGLIEINFRLSSTLDTISSGIQHNETQWMISPYE